MTLVVGVGTSTGAAPAEVSALVDEALAAAGLALSDVVAVATIESKAGDRAIATLGWPVVAYTPDELKAVAVPHSSERAESATGTPSVAEAAALLGAGTGATLVVTKTVSAHATVAVARRSPR